MRIFLMPLVFYRTWFVCILVYSLLTQKKALAKQHSLAFDTTCVSLSFFSPLVLTRTLTYAPPALQSNLQLPLPEETKEVANRKALLIHRLGSERICVLAPRTDEERARGLVPMTRLQCTPSTERHGESVREEKTKRLVAQQLPTS